MYPFGISSNGCWSEGTIARCDNNLYPNAFAHGGETYKIDCIILTSRGSLFLRMDSAIPGAQDATLVVGGTSLEFDASATVYPRWHNTGLD